MKKVAFVLIFGFIFVTMGCINKAEFEELKKQNEELIQSNNDLRLKVEEISAENEKLIAENSDLLNKLKDLEKEKRILELKNEEVRYVHNQTLDFKYSGFDTKVYNEPLSEEVIYTVQTGDKIQVSAILLFESVKQYFVEVKTPSNTTGYIKISSNPFKDGRFLPLDTMTIEGKTVNILKMQDSYQIDKGAHLFSLPTENSEIIHTITYEEAFDYFFSSAITEDYKWVKIKVHDFEGWVKTQSLGKGRGGPLIWKPETLIEWVLIDSYFD